MWGLAPPRFLLQHPDLSTSARRLAMAVSLSDPLSTRFASLTSSLLAFDRFRISFFSPPPSSPFRFSSSSVAPHSRPRKCQATVRSALASHNPKRGKTATVCPGCGVFMQDKNPNAPGFFQRPLRSTEGAEEEEDLEELEVADEDDDDENDEQDDKEKPETQANWTLITLDDEEADELEKSLDDFGPVGPENGRGSDEKWKKNLDGFAPAGPEYGRGSSADGWNQVGGYRLDVKSKKMTKEKGKDKETEADKLLVCTRCHELRNYGKVKDEAMENLLPDFDFERTVGSRLMKTQAARTIVVMVVDSADFDGSFPRRAASLLSEVEEREGSGWKEKKSGNVPRLVLVVNKIDLLPKQISPIRLDHWVRRRAKEGGATRLSAVFLVSCIKSWGIKAAAQGIKDMAGPRGEVWVVGAQNAGKSSLINALAKVEEGAKVTQLTEAPVPGTTLGILRLDGIFPAKVKLFDTPGLLHPHQITVRLTREEQKIVQIRKELKPRTYRVKANDSIHVGGLVRLDVKEISASSMYITAWGSASLICHLGKTEKAPILFEKHVGDKLQPPINKERLEELGPWVQTPVSITGDSWDKSSIDIVVAGMGWFGVGLKATARINVWTYEGVAITTRQALVPDMASTFQKAGFTAVQGGTAKVN